MQPVLLQLRGELAGQLRGSSLVHGRGGRQLVVLHIQQQKLGIGIVGVVLAFGDDVVESLDGGVVRLVAVGIFGKGEHALPVAFQLAVDGFRQHQCVVIVLVELIDPLQDYFVAHVAGIFLRLSQQHIFHHLILLLVFVGGQQVLDDFLHIRHLALHIVAHQPQRFLHHEVGAVGLDIDVGEFVDEKHLIVKQFSSALKGGDGIRKLLSRQKSVGQFAYIGLLGRHLLDGVVVHLIGLLLFSCTFIHKTQVNLVTLRGGEFLLLLFHHFLRLFEIS